MQTTSTEKAFLDPITAVWLDRAYSDSPGAGACAEMGLWVAWRCQVSGPSRPEAGLVNDDYCGTDLSDVMYSV